jgi:signal transduction histidine kinase
MKKLLLLFCCAFAISPVWSQTAFPHRLKDLIVKIKADTGTGPTSLLTSAYVQNHPDSGIYYAKELITYGKQNNDRRILAAGLNIYSYALYNKGNYPAALNIAFQSLKIIENSTHIRVLAGIYNQVGNIYKGQQNYPKALYYYRRSKQVALASHDAFSLGPAYFNMAFVFKETNVLDSALYYSGLAVNDNNPSTRLFMGYILSTLGDEYLKLKNYKKALEYYHAAYKLDKKNADFRDASITCISLSKYYTFTGKPDSSIYYARQALYSAKKASYNKSVFESAALLARLYETKRQPDSGFKYLKLSSIAKDSLYNAAKSGEMENLTTDEFLRQNEIQAAQNAYQNRLKLYALIFGLLVLLIAALLQWRNSRQRKKAYSLLQQQNEEIEAQKTQAVIEGALERVRSKTMAMHNSQDVAETVAAMFDELVKLGIGKNVRCGIGIIDDIAHIELWTAFTNPDGQVSLIIGSLDMTIHPLLQRLYNAWKNKEGYSSYEMSGDDLIAYYRAINDAPDYPTRFDMASLPARQFHYDFFFPEGTIFAFSPQPLTHEATQIFKRFAGVFGLTYRRYLDLLKAEAQAREAQIELALERVRAKTMAMQKSDELLETSQVLFQQLRDLGETADQAGIAIVNEKERVFELFATIYGTQMIQVFRPKIDDPFVMGKVYKAWKAKEKSFVIEIAGEELRNYNMMRNKLVGAYYSEDIGAEDRWVVTAASFSNGILSFSSSKRPTNQTSQLLERFATVFDSTYTRFLDLQKAEVQAREAQIEAALERVRSRTMAMQKSGELAEVIKLIFEQLKQLNFNIDAANFGMDYKETDDFNMWIAATEQSFPTLVHIPYIDHPVFNRSIELKKNDVSIITDQFTFEEKNSFFKYFFEQVPGISAERQQFVLAAPGYVRSIAAMNAVALGIARYSTNPFTEEENAALKRFANVFEQTYTRFNDLQQAEAQAREAKIEVALERVRSRTMAMQKSDELAEVIQVVYEQLLQLNFNINSANFALDYKESDDFNLWISSAGQSYPTKVHIPYLDIPIYNRFIEAKKNKVDFLTEIYSFEEKNAFFDHFFKHVPGVSGERKEFVFNTPGYARSTVLLKNITLSMQNYAAIPYSEEENATLRRFGKVFEQTYTRFNDLQQAEAQAREAKIEAGLERVRAKAMSMQTSEELNELIGTVFGELTKLDVVLTRCLIMIFDPETKASRWWMANSEAPSEPMNYLVQYHEHDAYTNYIKAWSKRILKWRYELKGEVKKTWDDFLFVDTELSLLSPAVITGMKAPEQVILSASFNNFGCLTLVSLEPLSDEHFELLLRFAKVFDMSYTRFNDLKQAEAQAREAKIEAALEKVRGKAMAMYNSKDLSSTASMVFTELRKLGIDPIRCGVGIVSKDSPKVQLYSATISAEGDSLALMGWVELQGHPVLKNIYQSIVSNESYFPVLKGKQLRLYYEKLLSGLSLPSVPDWETAHEQFGHFFPFQDGCLYAWSEKPYAEAEIKILKRFASVIDLTFRRYIELQKSEASAREAIRQASLDRVRAEIASMRSTSDLQSITPLIWNELTTLGVPFIRCGVFIIDEQQEVIHSYLSTPDGKAIAAFQLAFNADGIAKTVLASWRKKQFAAVHWNEDEFKRLSVQLVQQGAIASEEKYLTDHPPTSLDLHFVPFLQGMLYVGNATPLSDDDINLVQSLADAFSTAYARYEDFNKLEAAKKEVEHTLTGLKAAQTQLIQSEKMASLGELTAGIAHEIQNPLNFVNNFSEVNQEMLEELKAETCLPAGRAQKPRTEWDEQLVTELINGLIENEQKINHHGKRADSIVKSMLEHSRTSSGAKEPTNINALAEEYIRLSYHGLRAKDKTFNSAMEVNLDNNLPKASVIPQDIGRVLLNLFNNAFYAVHQKKKQNPEGYLPQVTLTTANKDGFVEIAVKDNGNGIPDSIKDKIMQPFFTTKPTGEGTGLGLSLSYDIVVKGHGGGVSVDSTEGRGSEFIIKLPL